MPKKPISNILTGVFILAAFAGFADAAYLTVEHYAKAIPPCSLVNGCETVLTSPYATVGTVPISLVGAAYYLVLFALAVAYLDTQKHAVIKTAAYLTAAGVFTSAGLVALQLFIIKAVCLYCLVSAGISTLLFILGIMILKKLKESRSMGHIA